MNKARLLSLGFLIAFMAAGHAYCENLVRNGGFDEELFAFWKTDAWQTDHGTLTIVTEKAKNGGKSLKITDTVKANDIRYEQKIEVKPDTFYRLSGWISTKDVKPMDAKYGAIIGLESGLSGIVYAGNLKGTYDWSYAELFFKTSPLHDSVVVQARLGMFFSTVTGTAFFDDISLEEVDAPSGDYYALDSPGGESGNVLAKSEAKTEIVREPEKQNPPSVPFTVPPFVWLLLIGFMMMGLNIFFTLQREKKQPVLDSSIANDLNSTQTDAVKPVADEETIDTTNSDRNIPEESNETGSTIAPDSGASTDEPGATDSPDNP